MEGGKPERVTTDRRGLSGGRMEACAGPWRTSGGWWAGGSRKSQVASDKLPPAASDLPLATCHWRIAAWDRDEWDVTLNDGATYRLFRERDADRWYVEGIVD